jgi:competence protein ComEC
VLYGLGESFRSGGGQTERVTLPALSRQGATSLDAVILPVLDRDAGNGVTALTARLPVGGLFAPGADRALPPDISGCDGVVRNWDGWRFESRELSGAGCVLRVSGAGGRVLLADRVEAVDEAALLARWPEPVQVLLVPRHASASASTSGFVATLRPQVAVAGLRAGDRDRNGLQDVMDRYASVGSRWLDTATRGAIQLRLTAAGRLVVQGCRDERIGAWTVGALPRKSAAP